MKKLENCISLSHKVKIYVPSTINVNESYDNMPIVESVLCNLAKFFGGATSYPAFGAWVTSTGQLVNERITICEASYDNGLSSRDFRNYDECLYKKKTGEFFLQGEGGPMSKYAKSCGNNSWCGGKDIMPLSLEEAKRWVEEFANSDFEEIFGEIEE